MEKEARRVFNSVATIVFCQDRGINPDQLLEIIDFLGQFTAQKSKGRTQKRNITRKFSGRITSWQKIVQFLLKKTPEIGVSWISLSKVLQVVNNTAASEELMDAMEAQKQLTKEQWSILEKQFDMRKRCIIKAKIK